MIGKCRVVLTSQANWIISRKELEAAKICSELMLQVENALSHLNCSKHFWTDSKVVLGWITNSDLNLSRFVKRRIDRILRVVSSGAWKYVNTSENPADIGTRDGAYKRSESIDFWLQEPSFLLQQQVDVESAQCVSVCMTKLETESESGLDKIIEVCGDLYKLR